MASLILNSFILVEDYVGLFGKQITVNLVFVAIALMWATFIYWFRLFEDTMLFIELIRKTILDVKAFVLLFVFVLGCSANLIYILNKNKFYADEQLYDLQFSVQGESEQHFLSAVLNQYLLSLGEFSRLDSYKDTSVWITFIGCTMISQIILLNMLIAIMADTFDNIWENQKLSKLKLKVGVLSDYASLIHSIDD